MRLLGDRARKLVSAIVTAILDTLYPPRCPSCKALGAGLFCQDCWAKLIFIQDPCCFICGEPLEVGYREDILCPACACGGVYSFDRALSVFVYNRTIARAIHRFKFKHMTFLSKFFANFLLEKLRSLKSTVNFIIPVPIHRERLMWRGYNQALLLAKDVSEKSLISCIPNLLIKSRHTLPQRILSTRKRKSNLRMAFEINPSHLETIRDKNIMIVDDIFTTGTTVNECAKVLKRNGVRKVFVLTIAKTMLTRGTKLARMVRRSSPPRN